MKVAVLPINAAEGTPPALGRQFSNFISDSIRAATEADLNPVSFLAQIEDVDGPRAAYVNIADSLLDAQWLEEMFKQSGVDLIFDGLLKQDGDNFDLTARFHRNDGTEPVVRELKFTTPEVFPTLQTLLRDFAANANLTLPDSLGKEDLDFGTDSAPAFLAFLEGYDAVLYIQQANGRVAREFDPKLALESLIKSLEIDKDFVAPYEMLVQLCRLCAQFRIGAFEDALGALQKVATLVPDDFRGHFAMGELYQAVNDANNAANAYEKALQLAPEEPSIYTRLGLAQMNQGMPVNAERNFRKAVELEGDDKPSMDFLAGVLQQTNRQHEIPALWKDLIDKSPQNGQAWAKYGISLLQAGREEDGIKAFEEGLEKLEDPMFVKRFYAPVLAQKENFDRAMDFYEDCLDVAPADVPLLLEYAQTLQAAKREFEVPKVLRDVLAANPDPNTRANTLAWLIELEQPKRAEAVETAAGKMNEGKFEEAMNELRPLKNWLADYWKLWAVYASAANHLGQATEAEESARKLLDLFPACEPGYAELATALNLQDKHEEAYNVMRFAAQQLPQSLPIHINLALAAKRAGHEDEARALAKQIREAVGPNEDVERALAEIN